MVLVGDGLLKKMDLLISFTTDIFNSVMALKEVADTEL